MTPRSPKQQHPKTTTISRRLRNRADQELSVQPPEIPQLRSVRPRRAATLPTPRHDPLVLQPPESHPPPLFWETKDAVGEVELSGTSHPAELCENQPVDLVLAQALNFGPYDSVRGSHSELVPTTEPHSNQNYQPLQTSETELPPSPLPSVSGNLDFELPLSADPQLSHNPFIDLQDMRWVVPEVSL